MATAVRGRSRKIMTPGPGLGFRQLILMAHRWLGLLTATTLSIAGLTGSILVWGGQHWIRRIASPLHERLAMGRSGGQVVAISTLLGILVVSSGLILWWRRKIVVARPGKGWWRFSFDLHHSLGILGFLLMFLLTATGVGMTITVPRPIRRMIIVSHAAVDFPLVIKFAYALGSALFFVQAVTGIAMWWKSRQQNRVKSPLRTVDELTRTQ